MPHGALEKMKIIKAVCKYSACSKKGLTINESKNERTTNNEAKKWRIELRKSKV